MLAREKNWSTWLETKWYRVYFKERKLQDFFSSAWSKSMYCEEGWDTHLCLEGSLVP